MLTLRAGVATAELLGQARPMAADGPIAGVYWLPALDDEGDLDELDLRPPGTRHCAVA